MPHYYFIYPENARAASCERGIAVPLHFLWLSPLSSWCMLAGASTTTDRALVVKSPIAVTAHSIVFERIFHSHIVFLPHKCSAAATRLIQFQTDPTNQPSDRKSFIMPAPAKLLLALATIVLLCATLASAQTSSSSGAVPITTEVCEACRDGNCASGVQFCENGNNSSRLCCCPESAICEEGTYTTAATSGTEVCRCLSPLSDTLQTSFLIPSGVGGASGSNSKHGMTTATWVFFGIGAAFVAALIAFTIYYKLKKRQIEKRNNNQQQLLETSA